MQRGFDKLANPAGMLIVLAFGFLLIGTIVVGSRWILRQEARGKAERARLREEQERQA